MQLGSLSQTVSVTGEAPLVNTTSGSLGALVDSQQISDIPLNGRNYVDLMLLQPGIPQQTNKAAGGGQVGTWFSSNGAPVRSNNMLLDGADHQQHIRRGRVFGDRLDAGYRWHSGMAHHYQQSSAPSMG